MKKFKKSFLFILILFISIGFAVLTANLNLNSVLSFKQNVFDVHIENPSINESTTSLDSSTILVDNTTLSFSTTYTKPGDAVDILFYIVNDGTIDASISNISTTLTSEQAQYIDYSFKYVTDNSIVKKNDIIFAGQARKVIGHFEYKYDIEDFINLESFNTTITINFVQAQSTKNNVWAYEYVGDYQTFTAPKTGIYKIELWGAQGGAVYDEDIGKGAYTSGKIALDKNNILYIYVGEEGKNTHWTSSKGVNNLDAGFNVGGGTQGQNTFETRYYSNGGGATDIRFINGSWDNFNSLKSRIMVAAGGGGSYEEKSSTPYKLIAGSGGGLVGYDGNWSPSNPKYGRYGTGGSQISGGYASCLEEDNCFYTIGYKYAPGSFGKGGCRNNFPATCGGGGYFGGGGSSHVQTGGGGSSYISGHNGCVAIEESSTENNITFPTKNGVACTDGTTDQDCSVHYSGKEFTDTVMIDGQGYKWTTEKGSEVVGMPTHSGTGTMTGNIGDGYAKITLEDSVLCKRATTLHTTTCQNTSGEHNKMCTANGYAIGDTIIYGTIPSSKNYKSGDAFDCDVNGDGDYDSINERFYYVTDLDSNKNYAVLIYSDMTVDGVKWNKTVNPNIFYDNNNKSYLGPTNAYLELPNASQWPNIRLYNHRRQIKYDDNLTTYSSYILPVFNYTNLTSRLITNNEVSVCNKDNGYLRSDCEFLLEGTSFDKNTNSFNNWGQWIETPVTGYTNRVRHIDSHSRRVGNGYTANNQYMGVKPVIEVPKNRME